MMTSPMTAAEAERLAKMEGLVLVPSNSGPHHPRYLGVSMHTDPATNEVFFCASVIQGGTTLYLQDAHGNVKFTSDAEAALTFARYTAGRLGMDEHPQAPVMTKARRACADSVAQPLLPAPCTPTSMLVGYVHKGCGFSCCRQKLSGWPEPRRRETAPLGTSTLSRCRSAGPSSTSRSSRP